MNMITIPANYYEQFDADYNLDVPAEGFGGWKKTSVEINPERTAVVSMHAWDCGTREQYPGWYRVAEFLPRTKEICRSVFPPLLTAVRNSRLKLYHVSSSEDYCKEYEGYKIASKLNPSVAGKLQCADEDESYNKLQKFRQDSAYLGIHNQNDIEYGVGKIRFPKEAEPMGHEGIAVNADQLFALCKRDGVNHLIYIGFAINWCLQASEGGMIDMERRGMICSTIRQAVTAVENKETARSEMCKELALWRIAVAFGFVFDSDDFINAIL